MKCEKCAKDMPKNWEYCPSCKAQEELSKQQNESSNNLIVNTSDNQLKPTKQPKNKGIGILFMVFSIIVFSISSQLFQLVYKGLKFEDYFWTLSLMAVAISSVLVIVFSIIIKRKNNSDIVFERLIRNYTLFGKIGIGASLSLSLIGAVGILTLGGGGLILLFFMMLFFVALVDILVAATVIIVNFIATYFFLQIARKSIRALCIISLILVGVNVYCCYNHIKSDEYKQTIKSKQENTLYTLLYNKNKKYFIYGNKIWYFETDKTLNTVDFDGTNKEKICDANNLYNMNFLTIYNNEVYFYVKYDNSKFAKYNMNTKEETVIGNYAPVINTFKNNKIILEEMITSQQYKYYIYDFETNEILNNSPLFISARDINTNSKASFDTSTNSVYYITLGKNLYRNNELLFTDEKSIDNVFATNNSIYFNSGSNLYRIEDNKPVLIKPINLEKIGYGYTFTLINDNYFYYKNNYYVHGEESFKSLYSFKEEENSFNSLIEEVDITPVLIDDIGKYLVIKAEYGAFGLYSKESKEYFIVSNSISYYYDENYIYIVKLIDKKIEIEKRAL